MNRTFWGALWGLWLAASGLQGAQYFDKFVKKVVWEGNNERFSLVYDARNDLIWAMQIPYLEYARKHPDGPLLEAVAIANAKNPYYRKYYLKFDTVVYTGNFRKDSESKVFRFSDDNAMRICYASKEKKASRCEPFGSLRALSINGIRGEWRLPTVREYYDSSPYLPYQKLFRVHYNIQRKRGRIEECTPNDCSGKGTYSNNRENLGVLTAYVTPMHGGLTDGLAVLNFYSPQTGLYTKRLPLKAYLDHWSEFRSYRHFTLLLPVKKPRGVYERIAFDPALDGMQKLARLTDLLCEEALKVKRRAIEKPAPLPREKPRPLQKGEFEKSSEFQKRVEQEQERVEKANRRIEELERKKIKAYEEALAREDRRYKEALARNSDPAVVRETAERMAAKAMRMIFGDPKISDIRYDADREIFFALLRSSSGDFKKRVQIPVPIAEARSFKARVTDEKLIPRVVFEVSENGLRFLSMESVSNRTKIDTAFRLARKEDTPEAYEEFLREYPGSYRQKEAEALLKRARERKRLAEAYDSVKKLEAFLASDPDSAFAAKAKARIRELKASAERKREERERKLAAYRSKKRIGEKVCNDGTMAMILPVTIRAFVEEIHGDRIRLRIADTEGTTPYYDGTRLYNGTVIWDRFDRWYSCE